MSKILQKPDTMSVYLCPSTTREKCTWEGPGSDVVAHFEDCHNDYFLDSNQINFDISIENKVNYLMNLFGQTYLIQTNYSKTYDEDKIELKLRYLGSAEKASKIRYYLEVVSGNFGFTSKNIYDGYNTITSRNGTITVDVQGIKLMCGRINLDYLTGYIHVENDTTNYAYRSIRRRQFDNKTVETKTRVSFRRRLSQKSVRRNSLDSMEFVDAIKNCNKEDTDFENIDNESQLYCKFVDDIIKEIFFTAMDEIYRKDVIPRKLSVENCPFSDIQYLYDNVEKNVEKNIITDVVLFKTREEIFKINPIYNETEINEVEVDTLNENTTFKEDVVSKLVVPNAELPSTEFIDDNDMQHSMDSTNEEKLRQDEDEINYLKKLVTIRCQNCALFMTPPIFMCVNGHSVCLSCKLLLCDVCDQEVTDVRNYDLEDISRSISHPCRFSARGCKDTLSCYEIRHHEVYCDHCIYVCPLCCKMGNFFKIRSHVRLVHPSLKIVETNEHPFVRDSSFLIANKLGVFHCTSQIKNSSIEWRVKYCGMDMITVKCEVRIKGKKHEKSYSLQKNGNVFETYIFLNELKSARVKEKNAVLYISAW